MSHDERVIIYAHRFIYIGNLDFFLSFQMAASAIEQEGPDNGVGDFVLLSEISMDAFLKNLKLR